MSKGNMTQIQHDWKTEGGGYTNIANDCLRDGTSTDGIALLFYLRSRPHNWELSKAGILADFPIMGRKKLEKALKELRDRGYLTIEQGRRKSGSFGSVHYIINDTPHRIPQNGETVDGEVVDGEAVNGEPVKEQQINTDRNNYLSNNHSKNNYRESNYKSTKAIDKARGFIELAQQMGETECVFTNLSCNQDATKDATFQI